MIEIFITLNKRSKRSSHASRFLLFSFLHLKIIVSGIDILRIWVWMETLNWMKKKLKNAIGFVTFFLIV